MVINRKTVHGINHGLSAHNRRVKLLMNGMQKKEMGDFFYAIVPEEDGS